VKEYYRHSARHESNWNGVDLEKRLEWAEQAPPTASTFVFFPFHWLRMKSIPQNKNGVREYNNKLKVATEVYEMWQPQQARAAQWSARGVLGGAALWP